MCYRRPPYHAAPVCLRELHTITVEHVFRFLPGHHFLELQHDGTALVDGAPNDVLRARRAAGSGTVYGIRTLTVGGQYPPAALQAIGRDIGEYGRNFSIGRKAFIGDAVEGPAAGGRLAHAASGYRCAFLRRTGAEQQRGRS